MDIMELGAIGELVGGVAVVGSLIYVGLQVRQSNRLAQADAVQAYVVLERSIQMLCVSTLVLTDQSRRKKLESNFVLR